MQREQLYHKTVDILVQAYFNDELIAGNCTACACGNLIAGHNGYKIVSIDDDAYWVTPTGDYLSPRWVNAVCTERSYSEIFGFVFNKKAKQKIDISRYGGAARNEILSTGYQLHDFAKIEKAFEENYFGRDKMFNALMGVVDALDQIHENKDEATTQSSKKKFNKEITNNTVLS